MSKANYRKCVRLGVTGKNTSTCFPAAIDKLLAHQRVSPEYYQWYDYEMSRYLSLPNRQRNPLLRTLYDELQAELDADPFTFARVRCGAELREVVRRGLREGGAVVLDLAVDKTTSHSVGVEPVDLRKGYYQLQSTNIPPLLRGVVTMGYVFDFLDQNSEPPRVRFPFNDANVTIISA